MKREKQKTKDKGFTILEMVVYIGILAIVFVVLISFLLWMVRANTKTVAMQQVASSARSAIDEMAKEIREAESVYTPTYASSTQISFETRKNPPPGEDSTYIDFFLCGTRLCVRREGANPIALTSQNVIVSNLSFQEVRTGEASSVRIAFDVERDNPTNLPELVSSMRARAVVSLRSY